MNWISVKDRLPKTFEIIVDEQEKETGYLWILVDGIVYTGWYNTRYGFDSFELEPSDLPATHWMYKRKDKPEPPNS